MSIVAERFRFVVGVDTHARNHVYAIVAARSGELVETRDFPTSAAGMKRALKWSCRRTGDDRQHVLWVIEGAASYGALLAGAVATAGFEVAEAARMDARARHGIGKSDPLDAARIARGPRDRRRPVALPAPGQRRTRRLTHCARCPGLDDRRAHPRGQRPHRTVARARPGH